jgi:hypothetical protein
MVSMKNILLSASRSFFDLGERLNEGRQGLYVEIEERRPRGSPGSEDLSMLVVEKSK